MSQYNRVLVKISGEAFAGKKGFGIDENAVSNVARQLVQLAESGVEVGVVVGGGNFWRGRTSPESMERVTADQIGMLATVMNALALCDAIIAQEGQCDLFSAIEIKSVVLPHIVDNVWQAFESGCIAVFAGGTGSAYFSTDTAAVLRACEIEADAVLCAKAVDGVYDSDPRLNPDAKKYDEISYDKVIADNLHAMDLTAIALARENNIPVVCFGKDERDGLYRIAKGEKLGTVIR
ncbi:MAG: UMP kinase [Corallococcus sp.]|nr:UMP kinase [Corallococcus sp.]MCM1359737.1 UMP kinase [Corallococcus sp.]MCM1395446.1 UMP kinase [Corallococcus sp.]